MGESISGCVTMSFHNARLTGRWIMINRRRRIFLPFGVGTVSVGDVVTITGWQEEDHESVFVMAQSCEPASLSIPGDADGLSRALYPIRRNTPPFRAGIEGAVLIWCCLLFELWPNDADWRIAIRCGQVGRRPRTPFPVILDQAGMTVPPDTGRSTHETIQGL